MTIIQIIALGLGLGMFGGLVQDTWTRGFDGLSLLFLSVAVLLVYAGGKQVLR